MKIGHDICHSVRLAPLRGTQTQELNRPRYRYAKGGVMLINLRPATSEQLRLDLCSDNALNTQERTRLMHALGSINQRYARGTVQLASAGTASKRRIWEMKQERKTPGYTTDWARLVMC